MSVAFAVPVFLPLYLFLSQLLSDASSVGEMSTSSVEDGSKQLRSERSNVPLEGDGVRLEVINQLQGSVTAYKGHLTRRYNEIRSLFANAAPVSEIMMKKNSLDDLFSRYSTVVERRLQTVVDLDDKERVAFNYQCELDVRCLFQEEFSGRIRSM